MMLLWSPHLVHGSCKELVLPIRTGSTHGGRLLPVMQSLMTPEVTPDVWQNQDAVRERLMPRGVTDCCWWTTKGRDQAAVSTLARAMSQPAMPPVGTGSQEHSVGSLCNPCTEHRLHCCACQTRHTSAAAVGSCMPIQAAYKPLVCRQDPAVYGNLKA